MNYELTNLAIFSFFSSWWHMLLGSQAKKHLFLVHMLWVQTIMLELRVDNLS